MRRCVTDYLRVDWTRSDREVLAAHEAATRPCSNQQWYRETAFQNGVLAFMVLVGEQQLTDASTEATNPEAGVASLRAQGFDQVGVIEISSSGRCEDGRVQTATLHLNRADPDPTQGRPHGPIAVDDRPRLQDRPVDVGLAPLLDSARSAGALVRTTGDPAASVVVIQAEGLACATGIVATERQISWITSSDESAVRDALGALGHLAPPSFAPEPN